MQLQLIVLTPKKLDAVQTPFTPQILVVHDGPVRPLQKPQDRGQ